MGSRSVAARQRGSVVPRVCGHNLVPGLPGAPWRGSNVGSRTPGACQLPSPSRSRCCYLALVFCFLFLLRLPLTFPSLSLSLPLSFRLSFDRQWLLYTPGGPRRHLRRRPHYRLGTAARSGVSWVPVSTWRCHPRLPETRRVRSRVRGPVYSAGLRSVVVWRNRTRAPRSPSPRHTYDWV